ncbi:MAG: type II secretion system F family protein [bacterium]
MPVFQYQATDAAGRPEEGLAHGTDLASVIQQLTSRGLQVTSVGLAQVGYDPLDQAKLAPEQLPASEAPRVEEREPPPTEPRPFFQSNVVGPMVGGVKLEHLNFFFKQLSVMLNSGINPVDSLETLSKQTQSLKLKAVIKETSDHVLAGRPLSAGFQRYPEVFSPLMLSMIRVGERSGLISEQCRLLSDYIQRDIELRNMIRRETAYPKIVLWSSMVIILLTNTLITSVIAKPGAQTIMVPWVVWVFIFAVGAFAFFMNRFGLKIQAVKQAWDGFLLYVPGVGGMVLGFAMAKFGRAFAALYKSGVPLAEGLILAADSCGNEAIRARIHPAGKKIEQGHGIASTLRETGAFSPIVLDMASTGEMTGNIDEMMEKASDFYEDEAQTNARKGAMILGVVCLVLAGIYVLYIAVSFYSGYGARLEDAGS